MKKIAAIILILVSCKNESKPPLTKEDSDWIKKRTEEVYASAKLFPNKLNENKAILAYTITDVGFLYIAVVNDGTDKTPMATYYCRLAKEYGKSIKAVKVVDAVTFKHDDESASGKELGKCFCD